MTHRDRFNFLSFKFLYIFDFVLVPFLDNSFYALHPRKRFSLISQSICALELSHIFSCRSSLSKSTVERNSFLSVFLDCSLRRKNSHWLLYEKWGKVGAPKYIIKTNPQVNIYGFICWLGAGIVFYP